MWGVGVRSCVFVHICMCVFGAVCVGVRGCINSLGPCLHAEWIEEHSSAGGPLANYATNHLETYRDPQVPPPLPPGPGGPKRTSIQTHTYTPTQTLALNQTLSLINCTQVTSFSPL